MNPKNRRFSIPFNGSDVDSFISRLEPYNNNIDSIFLAPPFLSNNHANIAVNIRNDSGDCYDEVAYLIEYDKNCYEFLEKTKPASRNFDFKRIIPINSAHYSFTDKEIQSFVHYNIGNLVEKYEIEGLIMTDFNMARYVHQIWPHLELHTSCNCFQWNIRQMKLWEKECGISVFNPPREILRSPDKLKEMHDAGFKLKCLVNEGCLFGCPQTINHCMMRALNKFSMTNCLRGDLANIFKGNYILPRWLKELDEYVDIYKIAGRGAADTERIFNTLAYYVDERDDITLNDLIFGGVDIIFSAYPELGNIKVSELHDRLLTCECKYCDESCSLCRDLLKKYIEEK